MTTKSRWGFNTWEQGINKKLDLNSWISGMGTGLRRIKTGTHMMLFYVPCLTRNNKIHSGTNEKGDIQGQFSAGDAI